MRRVNLVLPIILVMLVLELVLNTPISRASAEDLSKYPVLTTYHYDIANVTYYDLLNGTILAVVESEGNVFWVTFPANVSLGDVFIVKLRVVNLTWVHQVALSMRWFGGVKEVGKPFKWFYEPIDVYGLEPQDLPYEGVSVANTTGATQGSTLLISIIFTPYRSFEEELRAYRSGNFKGYRVDFIGTTVGDIPVARLHASYNELLRNYSNLEENFTRLNERYKELNASYNDLLERYQNLTSAYNKLLKEHEKLKKYYEEEVERLNKELVEAGETINEWKAKYNNLLAEHQQLKNDYNTLKNNATIMLILLLVLGIGLITALVEYRSLKKRLKRRLGGG